MVTALITGAFRSLASRAIGRQEFAMRDYDETETDYEATYYAALIVVVVAVVGWSVGCAIVGAAVWKVLASV